VCVLGCPIQALLSSPPRQTASALSLALCRPLASSGPWCRFVFTPVLHLFLSLTLLSQGPMIAYAVHHVGEAAVFVLLAFFAVAPIIALLRTLKLDEQGSKARAAERPKSVIKEM
jgi:hypothetical protein